MRNAGDLLEPLNGLITAEERGGLFKGEALRLKDVKVDEDALESEPHCVCDLRRRAQSQRAVLTSQAKNKRAGHSIRSASTSTPAAQSGTYTHRRSTPMR